MDLLRRVRSHQLLAIQQANATRSQPMDPRWSSRYRSYGRSFHPLESRPHRFHRRFQGTFVRAKGGRELMPTTVPSSRPTPRCFSGFAAPPRCLLPHGFQRPGDRCAQRSSLARRTSDSFDWERMVADLRCSGATLTDLDSRDLGSSLLRASATSTTRSVLAFERR